MSALLNRERGLVVKLKVNGQVSDVHSDPDTPLLWVLRDELRLVGAKYGCGMAQCGVCTVFVEGRPVRSCVTALKGVEGKSVITPEGLDGPVAEAVRTSWIKHEVAQCGFCQSGQILAAVTLLKTTSSPTDTEISEAMSPYLCRCATYGRIRLALHAAAQALKG